MVETYNFNFPNARPIFLQQSRLSNQNAPASSRSAETQMESPEIFPIDDAFACGFIVTQYIYSTTA